MHARSVMANPKVMLALAAALPTACCEAKSSDPPEPLRESARAKEFFELVGTRRSIRSFTAEAVTERDLERILQAANRAPSAGNLQAYEIVVVTDHDGRQRLSRAAFGQPCVAEAKVLLVFLANPARSAARYAARGERLFALQDATIAASYAQLAVHALGLASVWIGAFEDRAVLDAVNAPRALLPSSLLAIGHAAESPPLTPRRDLRDLVHRERLRSKVP